VTLGNDMVMDWVRLLFGALPANAANNSNGGADWKGHDFVSQYLEGDVTGPMIVQNINTMIDRMPSPPTGQNVEGNSEECQAEEPANPEADEQKPEEDPSAGQIDDTPVEGVSETEGEPGVASLDRHVEFECPVGAGVLKVDGVDVFSPSEASCAGKVLLNLPGGEHTFTIEITKEEFVIPEPVCLEAVAQGYATMDECLTGLCIVTGYYEVTSDPLDSGSITNHLYGILFYPGDLGPYYDFSIAGRAGTVSSVLAENQEYQSEGELNLISEIVATSPECVIDMNGR